MLRSSPPLLPGKVLRPIHLNPIETLGLAPDIVESETKDLLTMGLKHGWMSESEYKEVVEALKNQNYTPIFNKTAMWHEKLNPKDESHSKAMAGWMLIQNIRVGERKLSLYHKPYKGLRAENCFVLRKNLGEAIDLEKRHTNSPDLQQRHLLSLMICQRIIKSNFSWGPKGVNTKEGSFSELKHFLLGKEIYKGNPKDHSWTLSLVYGFLRDNNWLTPNLQKIKEATVECWNSLDPKNKEFIKTLERRINI